MIRRTLMLGMALAAAAATMAPVAAHAAQPTVPTVVGLGCGFATTNNPTTTNKPNTLSGEVNAGPLVVTTGAGSVTIKCTFKVGASLTTAPTRAVATSTTPGTVGVLAATLSLGTINFKTTNTWVCTSVYWTAGVGAAGAATLGCTKATQKTTSICGTGAVAPTAACKTIFSLTKTIDCTLDTVEGLAPTAAKGVVDTVESILVTTHPTCTS